MFLSFVAITLILKKKKTKKETKQTKLEKKNAFVNDNSSRFWLSKFILNSF